MTRRAALMTDDCFLKCKKSKRKVQVNILKSILCLSAKPSGHKTLLLTYRGKNVMLNQIKWTHKPKGKWYDTSVFYRFILKD